MDRRRDRSAHPLRAQIAREAAALMYREGVSQYFDAKRIAARRILGRTAQQAKFRPGLLPSNGEIREALLEMAALAEGSHREDRLFAMRAVALWLMHRLMQWDPRLIGSVWSGHARRGSDIDLHVFVDGVHEIEHALLHLGWDYEHEEVLIRVGNGFRLFHHLHVSGFPFPVELSVYPWAERRTVSRSSTDGRPIDRVSAARLAERIQEDHPAQWAQWSAAGGAPSETSLLALTIPDDQGEAPGPFDGLLAELDGLADDPS